MGSSFGGVTSGKVVTLRQKKKTNVGKVSVLIEFMKPMEQ